MVQHRKRVLFVTPPGYGHFLPLVPLAWALQTSGQDVLVATSGVSIALTARAGLAVVNVAPGADLNAIYRKFQGSFRVSFYGHESKGSEQETSSASAEENVFTALSDAMIGALMNLVDEWRPNLIIHTPYTAAGPLVGTKYCIPTVFLGIGVACTPRAMIERIYSKMSEKWQRLGIDKLQPASAWIDVSPPSLRTSPSDGWLMRHIPYTGGELLETNSLRSGSRSRVAVTIGTVVPLAEGTISLHWLINAARDIDAEFVITHGTRDAGSLGELPPNVRAVSWLGHSRLFSTSQAVIHHGGPDTMLHALDAGLPQLVVPRGGDQFYNAEVLRRRGVALAPRQDDLCSSTLRTLLTDQGLRSAAEEVCNEMKVMPAPIDIVPSLLGLTQ